VSTVLESHRVKWLTKKLREKIRIPDAGFQSKRGKKRGGKSEAVAPGDAFCEVLN